MKRKLNQLNRLKVSRKKLTCRVEMIHRELPKWIEEIDGEIKQLIRTINTHPKIATTLSCSGHAAICLGQTIFPTFEHSWTTDDIGLSIPYNSREDPIYNCSERLLNARFKQQFHGRYCEGTSQPFITLLFSDIDLGKQVFNRLQNDLPTIMPRPYISAITEKDQNHCYLKVQYNYGNGDEGYCSENYREDSNHHHFADFWIHFANCINNVVTGINLPDSSIPKKFLVDIENCDLKCKCLKPPLIIKLKWSTMKKIESNENYPLV